MKVLHILYSDIGGTFDVVHSIIKKNSNSYWIDQMLLTGPNLFNSYKYRAHKLRIKINFIKTIRFLPFLFWIKIYLKIKKLKPDIIMLNNNQIFPSILYKLIYKKKIIYVDHNPYFLHKKISIQIVDILSKFFCDFLITVSKKNFIYYLKKIGIKKNLKFVRNGIDISFFSINKKKKLNRNFYIGMAGRINETKLQELIIRSLAKIRKNNIKVTFAGDGPKIPMLKKIIIDHDLKKQIKFVGKLDSFQLKKWFNKIDLYIQASKGEAMSISVLQAFAASVPVLASRVVGLKEIINEKKNIGFIFDNNVTSLVKKIISIMNLNKNRIKRIIKKQKKYVKKYFSEQQMFLEYKKIITNLT
jgi:glycosyltransferase involved in cell wall biosynthesis